MGLASTLRTSTVTKNAGPKKIFPIFLHMAAIFSKLTAIGAAIRSEPTYYGGIAGADAVPKVHRESNLPLWKACLRRNSDQPRLPQNSRIKADLMTPPSRAIWNKRSTLWLSLLNSNPIFKQRN